MADHNHFIVARLVIAGSYGPAEYRGGVEGPKEISVDARRAHAFRRAMRGKTED